ncbi:MAG: sigma-54-dependent Fis family transcriptional regulator [Oligoflexia bacterium]|nr:sigma-54-dependent Fis family transcriptional regulator [Oligoflexia bacterium]
MQKSRILVCDDESSIRSALFRALEKRGHHVLTASCISEAESLTSGGQSIDLLLVDIRLPDGDGLEFMAKLQKTHHCQSIVMTGFGSIDNAIEATKRGAFHYVTKPFNIDEVLALTDKALESKRLSLENKLLRQQLHEKYKFENIIGQSEAIMKVFELIEIVADSNSTVLITGESGTGKELIAKAIHYNSSRASKLMVPVNCGAIPGELLESELFGHVRGAFTGAISNRQGRFEIANDGTIFLDEIGDMSPNLQVKILRVLQERRFEAVGSTKPIEVDVRIIAATNKDLEKAVLDKSFREDLFYRLNVIPIKVPALRDRKSDIPLLINHFITQFNELKKRDIQGFDRDALEVLMEYNWPGNVRELENLIERLVILKGRGVIGVYDLPERYQQKTNVALNPDKVTVPEKGLDFNSAVDNFENALIMQALERTSWNRNKAANLLNLNRTTLVEKIKKKGLIPPDRSV